MTQQIELPGGKGPVSKASDADLDYWAKRTAAGLEEDPNGRWAAKNRILLDAIRGELKQRRGAAVEAKKVQSQAIAKTATVSLGAAIHDPSAVTAHLAELAKNYHIVSPLTRVDMIPEGCGVAVTYVTVNPSTAKDGPKEVYPVGDRLGLSMDTLKRIGAAAGIDWDPRQCGRLDNGEDPHYCHYRAVGFVRNFDGSIRTVSGEVEIDARDGSPQLEEIITKATNAKTPRDPKPQILELRKFLLRHAESKAKNRAIADMGVKRSYAPAELNKPFAVARLMWTGETQDPALRRVFAEKTAESMLGGMTALYGNRATPVPQRAAAAPSFEGHVPPPVGGHHQLAETWEPFDWETEPASEPKNEVPVAEEKAS